MERNERTLQMMQNYISLHAEGLAPSEIAKKFGLSTRTVYYVLQEIADKAGVPRESLLKTPHSEHQPSERITEPVKPIDVEAFRNKIQSTLVILGELREMIQLAIEDAEKFEEMMGMEVSDGNYNDEGEERSGGAQGRNDD